MNDTLEKSIYFANDACFTQGPQVKGAGDDVATMQPQFRHEQARIDLTTAPSRIFAEEAERPTFCRQRERGPLLLRVRTFLRGVIHHQQEDDIVKHYEGHSWCDSTERGLNYDLMTRRWTKSW